MTDPGRTWDDLVVPEDTRSALRAIARRARARARAASEQGPARSRRRARSGPVLFVGASGTGKTLATEIIAATTGLPIQELDIGPALAGQHRGIEHRVVETLDAGQTHNAIVVIDGAAPLLRPPTPSTGGSGTDSSTSRDDELSALIEHVSGLGALAIVTATMSRGIDPALAERFASVVEFPLPQSEARLEIWRRCLPEDAEIADGTLHYLASWLAWTGGTIHGCCMAAAEEAATEGVALQLRHVSRVLDRGYRSSARSYAREPEPPSRSPSPAQPAATRSAHRRDGRRWPTIAGGVAITAALVGLIVALAAGATSKSPRRALARVGAVRVSLPTGWHQEPSSDPAPFGLARTLTIAPTRSADGVLVIGQLAGDSSPLPRTVLAAVSPQATPEVVRLGPVVLYRYRAVSRAGVPAGEWIYTMPTTEGTVIATCGPKEGSGTFTTDCGRVLATIRLASGRSLPVGVSSAYARALSDVITQLNALRSTAARQLAAAGSAQTQAAAATRLAEAHAQAASSVSRLDAGQAATANAALAHALLGTSDDYRALALAASHKDLSAYRTARAALTIAAQRQGSAFQQLRAFGYQLG